MKTPAVRIRLANSKGLNPDGEYVLYWMVAFRRPGWNFALEHAVQQASQLKKPLVIFEPLRARYRWANDRMHRFIIEGMRDNQKAFADRPVTYYPYVEPTPGKGTPLFHKLAERACTVITDDYPSFFLPTLIKTVADRTPVSLELVDSNGVMPLSVAERTFTVAHSYRRWMQKTIVDHLAHMPSPNPLLRKQLPKLEPDALSKIQKRWPPADIPKLLASGGLQSIPIDHSVAPSKIAGGFRNANKHLHRFLKKSIAGYADNRNHPDQPETSSGLSPYFHFGHISAHQVVADVLDAEDWNPSKLSEANGKNRGFWGTSEAAEAYLDQVVTWREMGFNMTHRHPDTYDQYETLPNWALKTLDEHADDPRPYLYTLEEFETAQTHDELWNAAQRQLRQEGIIHNYLRMLWGKKILHWTQHPREALAIMVELNNKYALDGRDPNSYSGIFWTLGRYDRAWGPKRPIFGSVRYMTSDSARKKLKLDRYLEWYKK
ncbi:deoxyribodipyrimidine photolyase [Roseimaritima multifibrata]|uniref:Deoxyribodipyrimidine photo-lyase n=1 Tax=Roseimaritima multifibrata TaxID=1930274 RepID=A0A517MAM9_9BACT|nr:deoxyribodipyrimidine photolyase [Roseimaritima multifibrata]